MMPQVSVWKCPRTGNLFEDKQKYRKHLRFLAIRKWSQITSTRRALNARKATSDLQRCVSFEAISQWLISNPIPFLDAITTDRKIFAIDPQQRGNFIIKNANIFSTVYNSKTLFSDQGNWCGTLRLKTNNARIIDKIFEYDSKNVGALTLFYEGDGNFEFSIMALDFQELYTVEKMFDRV
jgi:hypothetical protein